MTRVAIRPVRRNGQGLSRIVTSPLKRAFETAEIVNRILGLSVSRHAGLIERAFGPHEGRQWFSGFVDADLEGMEPVSDFTTRIINALDEVLTRYPAPVLIVCHGGVYRAFAQVLCALPDARAANCVPFRFDPPGEHSSHWRITPVDPVRTEENTAP
ncbi:MAG: histidine phosphatase family protein [Rhodospirillaceae bacterium]|jgi:2,3-bisphosphoglycerate-dependent phosphoglycerate mutase|nr:histidine phosphatase family protein [Rhodospirillaceae bacterium]MBT5240885.1 histidine phosphatase family protein [Rhodospirillaceae bacterium]MBT5565014.1 histidine phosphatase family protein [Rhodospirillaceae bacterium]MBT6090222.1 histidine phosphatase family protein [Rhodospirillaceae bacterium]MBT6962382.1 histidine phosphatase family protein [Rhodospirillaceae bacterium]